MDEDEAAEEVVDEGEIGDDADDAEADDADAEILVIPKRRRGGVITAGLLGLEAALYGPRKNEIVQVADADGMPEPDFDVQLTPDPRDSVVTIRRRFWHKH